MPHLLYQRCKILVGLSGKQYFTRQYLDFEKVYIDLVKALLNTVIRVHYSSVQIIIEARTHTGGRRGAKNFIFTLESFLKKTYPRLQCTVKRVPSSMDILLELADIVSNTMYQFYRQEDNVVIITPLQPKLIKIKDPL